MSKKGKITKQQLSQSLLDEIMANTSNGRSSVVIRKHTVTITNPTESIFIGSEEFTDTDELLVFMNSVYLEKNEDYIYNNVTKSITPVDGTQWEISSSGKTVFNFVCLINTTNTVMIDGSKVSEHSITEDKFCQDVINKLNDTESNINGVRLVDQTINESKLSQELQEKLNSHYIVHTGRSSYSVNITEYQWSDSVNINNCFTKTISHALNSSKISISGINIDNNRSVPVSFRIIDDHNIEVECPERCNLLVSIVNINEINIVSSNNMSCTAKTFDITEDMWLLDNLTNIYTVDIECDNIYSILNVYDKLTNINISMTHKIVNNRLIRLISEHPISCYAMVICRADEEMSELPEIESLKLEIQELKNKLKK